MKKILLGVFLIALTVGLASGAAYALFSDTVNVNNLAITTGNADLKISVDGGNTWVDSYSQGPWLAQGVAPGDEDSVTFMVKNSSASSINLGLTTKLVSATGDWSALSGVLQVKFTDGATDLVGYQYLTWWNGAYRNLSITLAPNTTQIVEMYMRVPSSAGNTIANKWVSTNWILTGTQL